MKRGPPAGLHCIRPQDLQCLHRFGDRRTAKPVVVATAALLQSHQPGLAQASEMVRTRTARLDEVRTECTLWYLRNRIVACVLTKENKDVRWIIDNEGNVTLARMGEAIIKAWGGVPPAPPP